MSIINVVFRVVSFLASVVAGAAISTLVLMLIVYGAFRLIVLITGKPDYMMISWVFEVGAFWLGILFGSIFGPMCYLLVSMARKQERNRRPGFPIKQLSDTHSS
jgi:hypothetical protein